MAERQRRRGTQAVTIREVAARAGVSSMTVSRVINKDDKVNDNTRALVEAAIRELNYTPNPAARRLAGSEVLRIGLLYSNPSSAYLSEFLVGALDESSREGHQLVVEKCAGTAKAAAAVTRLLQGGVNAFILPPPLCESKPILSLLEAAGVLAVAVATGRPNPTMPTIRIDNYAAARQMTEHLIGQGHRRLGFIKGNRNQSASDMRLHGFLDACQAAGIGDADILTEQGQFDYASGLMAAERLLAADPRPTAIFAANDDMAAATISVAHRLRLDVPGDVAVAGFDDTLIATTVWPALTTIRQPIAAMGKAAVMVLANALRTRSQAPRAGDGPEQKLLGYKLVRRDSTDGA
ncbi:LacI family DNA-binding transcriptional regulator [Niveispirillum fermenti]|uniref:LacI family DNA-binding transcriptional regulator n=1 Tax=Niveispirillum fermenti TaxID=1233113 RepID=UPI003A83D131